MKITKKKMIKCLECFIEYIEETYMNKIVAIALVLLGVLSQKVLGDGTFLAFTALFGIALFFAEENHVLRIGRR